MIPHQDDTIDPSSGPTHTRMMMRTVARAVYIPTPPHPFRNTHAPLTDGGARNLTCSTQLQPGAAVKTVALLLVEDLEQVALAELLGERLGERAAGLAAVLAQLLQRPEIDVAAIHDIVDIEV